MGNNTAFRDELIYRTNKFWTALLTLLSINKHHPEQMEEDGYLDIFIDEQEYQMTLTRNKAFVVDYNDPKHRRGINLNPSFKMGKDYKGFPYIRLLDWYLHETVIDKYLQE